MGPRALGWGGPPFLAMPCLGRRLLDADLAAADHRAVHRSHRRVGLGAKVGMALVMVRTALQEWAVENEGGLRWEGEMG